MAEIMAVSGKFQRIIKLQTETLHAFNYFTDFGYILPRLPEVDRVLHYRDGRYRMIFGADDGRGHKMGIVFDIRHEVVENECVRFVSVPLTLAQLQADVTINAKDKAAGPLFPGLFSGEARFQQRGPVCEVTYSTDLLIQIEVPRFLNFLPRPMLQKIGDGLMNFKLQQVGDGLATKTPTDFAGWLKFNTDRIGIGTTSSTVATRTRSGITMVAPEKSAPAN